MNGLPQKYNDCYFYYYSSCSRGPRCSYRHASAALGTENVCELWKDGKCTNYNCEYRHMDTSKGKKRETIACFWENQPSGCLKVHCSFSHTKPRPNDQSANLILPLKAPEIKITAPKTLIPPPISATIEAQKPVEPSQNHLHANTGIQDDSFHLSIEVGENSEDEASPVKEVPNLEPLQKTKAKMVVSPRPQLKPRNIQDRIGPLPTNVKRSFDNNTKKKFKQNAETVNVASASPNVESIHIKTLDEIRRERAQQQLEAKNDDSGDSTKENKLHKRTHDQVEDEDADNSFVNSESTHIIEDSSPPVIMQEETSESNNKSVSNMGDVVSQPPSKKIKLDSAESHLDFIDDILGSDITTVAPKTSQTSTQSDSKSNDWMKEDFPELFDI